jgi:prevent-host-death family protein
LVVVERFVGVDTARVSLGRLVEEVAAGDEVVSLTKRGKALAVLISREEYLQLRLVATERAREQLGQALVAVRAAVAAAGLDPGMVEEALVAARRL